jgi:hypothetical protein
MDGVNSEVINNLNSFAEEFLSTTQYQLRPHQGFAIYLTTLKSSQGKVNIRIEDNKKIFLRLEEHGEEFPLEEFIINHFEEKNKQKEILGEILSRAVDFLKMQDNIETINSAIKDLNYAMVPDFRYNIDIEENSYFICKSNNPKTIMFRPHDKDGCPLEYIHRFFSYKTKDELKLMLHDIIARCKKQDEIRKFVTEIAQQKGFILDKAYFCEVVIEGLPRVVFKISDTGEVVVFLRESNKSFLLADIERHYIKISDDQVYISLNSAIDKLKSQQGFAIIMSNLMKDKRYSVNCGKNSNFTIEKSNNSKGIIINFDNREYILQKSEHICQVLGIAETALESMINHIITQCKSDNTYHKINSLIKEFQWNIVNNKECYWIQINEDTQINVTIDNQGYIVFILVPNEGNKWFFLQDIRLVFPDKSEDELEFMLRSIIAQCKKYDNMKMIEDLKDKIKWTAKPNHNYVYQSGDNRYDIVINNQGEMLFRNNNQWFPIEYIYLYIPNSNPELLFTEIINQCKSKDNDEIIKHFIGLTGWDVVPGKNYYVTINPNTKLNVSVDGQKCILVTFDNNNPYNPNYKDYIQDIHRIANFTENDIRRVFWDIINQCKTQDNLQTIKKSLGEHGYYFNRNTEFQIELHGDAITVKIESGKVTVVTKENEFPLEHIHHYKPYNDNQVEELCYKIIDQCKKQEYNTHIVDFLYRILETIGIPSDLPLLKLNNGLYIYIDIEKKEVIVKENDTSVTVCQLDSVYFDIDHEEQFSNLCIEILSKIREIKLHQESIIKKSSEPGKNNKIEQKQIGWQEISGDEISGDEISDEEISGDEILDEEISGDEDYEDYKDFDWDVADEFANGNQTNKVPASIATKTESSIALPQNPKVPDAYDEVSPYLDSGSSIKDRSYQEESYQKESYQEESYQEESKQKDYGFSQEMHAPVKQTNPIKDGVFSRVKAAVASVVSACLRDTRSREEDIQTPR